MDSVAVDELDEIARISGIPEIDRKNIFHALNQIATDISFVKELEKEYKDCNFIVDHMGEYELLYSVYFK